MSIFNRNLREKTSTRKPASENAVRCARMRRAAIADSFRIGFVSAAIAMGGFFATVFIHMELQRREIARIVKSGPIVLPAVEVDNLWALWVVMLIICILVGAAGCVLPILTRRGYAKERGAPFTMEELQIRRGSRGGFAMILKRRGWYFSAAFIAMWIVLMIFLQESDRRVFGFLSAMGFWCASVGVIGQGLFGRTGRYLVCSSCNHSMASWRIASQKCGECGTMWKEPWGARVGTRIVRWRLVVIGAGMFAASVALAVWRALMDR